MRKLRPGYDWTDGIGPRELRPRTFDLAWRAIETDQVGTNEFLAWASRLGREPMLAGTVPKRLLMPVTVAA